MSSPFDDIAQAERRLIIASDIVSLRSAAEVLSRRGKGFINGVITRALSKHADNLQRKVNEL